MRALGNLLHFLREAQLSRAAFRQPLEDAVRALVKTVQSVATMKVRWNACYALGKAFKNPDLPLGKWTATQGQSASPVIDNADLNPAQSHLG